MRHDETKDSGALKARTGYTVTEILPKSGDWTLHDIEIIDPSEDSSADVGTRTVSIDLAPGETVRVIFHNVPAS